MTRKLLLLSLLVVLPVFAQPVPISELDRSADHAGHDHGPAQDPIEMFRAFHNGYTVIVGDFPSWNEANALADSIRARGGRIDQIHDHRVMLGVVPPTMDAEVRRTPGVKVLSRRPVGLAMLPATERDEVVDGVLRFFNAVADGSHFRRLEEERERHLPAPQNDVLIPPAGWRGDGHAGTADEKHHLGYDNDVMSGRIGVSFFFVESNGTIDSNTYTWSSTDRGTIIGQASSGFNWWVSRASAQGITINYNLGYHWGESRIEQGYEPITRAWMDFELWVNPIMYNFGSTGTNSDAEVQAMQRVRTFNESVRTAIGGQSAHSVFIIYNPSPASQTFTDGYSAAAWLGGPFVQTPFRAGGYSTSDWGMVYAHEMGHIYYACDEYTGGCSGCGNCYGSGAGPRPTTSNGNCESSCNSSPANCIMRAINSTYYPCSYTKTQIGW